MYYASLAIAIASVAAYHLSMKLVPSQVNPFLPLAAAYLLAFACSVAGLFLWPTGVRSVSALHPGVIILGLSVVGIEIGFLLAYRAGVSGGYGALMVNLAATLVLLPVALIFFKDQLTPSKIAGIVFSAIGLALLLRPAAAATP
jgi:drug/metabolite transporter (DMT)-like permease